MNPQSLREGDDRAVRILGAGRLERAALGPLPADVHPGDEAEAYRLQAALHEWLSAAGLGALVGYKIGCTTEVMQRYLGIGGACAGGILAATVHGDGAVLPRAAFRRPGVECEIAVRLGDDLPAAGAPYDVASVADRIADCMPAIEIVDDRYADWRTAGAPLLIADDFFGAGCVLGAPVPGWRGLDLAAVRGSMRINGEEAGTGVGADVLGHPLAALAWLANARAASGGTLRAGDLVLTGSLVQTRWVERGDEVEVAFSGLGTVRVRFE